jgi:hypothetical protein
MALVEFMPALRCSQTRADRIEYRLEIMMHEMPLCYPPEVG